MAVTSGQYNLQPYLAETIISDAMVHCRQLAANDAPTVADLTYCLRRLNNLLKTWEIKGWLLWCYDWILVPLTQNKYRYTIGPGGDVDPGYRPMRVTEGSYLRWTCQPTPQDITLLIFSRKEYAQVTAKTQQGTPTTIYHDQQMSDVTNPVSYDPNNAGRTVLYVWPNPDQSIYTIYLNAQRPIQDLSAAGQVIDIPVEWYECVWMNLAAKIADAFEVPEDRIRRLKEEAAVMLDELVNYGVQEQAPMRFQPSFAWSASNRGGFR